MTRRRMELLSERPGQIALNTAKTFPVATVLLGTAALFALRHCMPKARRRMRAEQYG
jgi:hypothetical protein